MFKSIFFPFSSKPQGPRYGNFNMRTLSMTVDMGIIMIPGQLLSDFLTDSLFGPIPDADLNEVLKSENTQDAPHMIHALIDFITKQQMIERSLFEYSLLFLLIAAYTLPFWFKYSSTPGKMLFGYSIRDAATGEKMTRRQALIRFGAYIVSFLPFTLGFVWIIFNKKHQGLHDLIAQTVVVKKQKREPAPVAAAQ